MQSPLLCRILCFFSLSPPSSCAPSSAGDMNGRVPIAPLSLQRQFTSAVQARQRKNSVGRALFIATYVYTLARHDTRRISSRVVALCSLCLALGRNVGMPMLGSMFNSEAGCWFAKVIFSMLIFFFLRFMNEQVRL